MSEYIVMYADEAISPHQYPELVMEIASSIKPMEPHHFTGSSQ